MNGVSRAAQQHQQGEDDKPPAPPVRLTSKASTIPAHLYQHQQNYNMHQQVIQQLKNQVNKINLNETAVDSKPLPKEPEDEQKKKHLSKSSKGSFRIKGDKKGKGSQDSDHKLVISPPTNFEHTVHVGFDIVTGEFTGMPESWNRLLQTSNIPLTEQKRNPQTILEILKWFDVSGRPPGHGTSPKYMTIEQTLGKVTIFTMFQCYRLLFSNFTHSNTVFVVLFFRFVFFLLNISKIPELASSPQTPLSRQFFSYLLKYFK